MGGMGMLGGNSGGGSLIYIDDKIENYSSIFDNSVFSSNSDKDKQRVIKAIKNLNDGTDLEKYFDVDEILRYFAAHTVVVNLDSYTSNMQQNYYIYEKDGKISILPWDYGLAFGGFQSGNSTSVVNFPIDTPVSGVEMEDRPLLNKLLEVDEYRERYYAYLEEIAVGYFDSGMFEDTINTLDAKINEYVKNDTTSLSTYEQYQESLPILIELGKLRAKSIKGQLDGTIPSTTDGQKADGAGLIDASGITLSLLGTMGGGNRQNDAQMGQLGGFDGRDVNMPDAEIMQQAMQILMEAEGELTEDVSAKLLKLGLTNEQIESFSNMQIGRFDSDRVQNPRPTRGEQNNGWLGENPSGGDFRNTRGENRPGMNNSDISGASSGNSGNATVFVGILLLLGCAIFFIAKQRRR